MKNVKTLVSPFAQQLDALPTSVHRLNVADVATSYWTYGDPDSAHAVLFVHGFRGDHHGLESFAAELGDEYFCVIPDLPGFGESDDFTTSASIENYAVWLVEFAALFAEAYDLTVVGHSFGSIVVAASCAQGLRYERIALINPVAQNALRGPRGILTRLAVVYYWLALILPERVGFALLKNRLIVRIMSVTMAKSPDKELRAWIHNQHDRYFSNFRSRKAVMQAFKTSVSTDVSQYRDNLPEGILLLVADLDDITDIQTQREFAASLRSPQLHTVEGVGHLVHYEAYEWAADKIKQYIQVGERA